MTTSDLAVLSRKLAAEDYSSSRYVAEIALTCAGGEDILAQRDTLQRLSDDTSGQLKRNVFRNYSQFIETAKEISNLETDMLRLSHMITEQRKLLTSLVETSLLGDTVPLSHNYKPQEEVEHKNGNGRKKLEEVLQMVEGGTDILEDGNRKLIHDGDLIEMDTDKNIAMHRVHCYLTSDMLIVATWLPGRRGPVRYKLSSCYLLEKTPMVNVRDLSGMPNSIKILVPQEPRLFQCKDAKAKKEWLALYDEAKRVKRGGGEDKKKVTRKRKPPPVVPEVLDDLNPLNEGKVLNEDNENKVELPEWLTELSDTLDVRIAQREFENAVKLLQEARNTSEAFPDVVEVREAKEVIKTKEKSLVEVLRNELKVSGEKSLQAGPSSARRAVHLLSELGRSTEAKELLLLHRTALNRHKIHQVRTECATRLYLQRLTSTFFHQVSDCVKEFDKCFNDQQHSLLLLWLEDETQWFYSIMDRQIFTPPASLRTVADCVKILHSQAEVLLPPGLGVLFMLETKLLPSLENIIGDTVDRAVEAVKLRHAEDTWEVASPISMASLGSVTSMIPLDLTRNTVSFSLAYLTLVDDMLEVFSQRLRHVINDGLVAVLHAHISLVAQAVREERMHRVDPGFVVKNTAYLLDTVLSLVEGKYREKTKSECCAKLAKLHSNYVWLKDPEKVGSANLKQPNYL